MKARHLLPLLLVPSIASAEVAAFERFLGASRPNYDPTELEAREVDSGRDFAPFSPADSDLGVQEILGQYKRLPPVRVEVTSDFYWTDNAPAATRSLDDESWLWAGRVAASWQPRIASGWFADLGVDQQMFQFDQGDAVDFENLQVYAGVVKMLPDLDDLILFGRFEYQILTVDTFDNTAYETPRVRVGAQKVLFNTPHHHIAAGISGAFDLGADPDVLERNDYSVDLHYTWFITDHVSTTLSYQANWWDFDQPTPGFFGGTKDRRDFNQVAGLELAYQPWKNARLYTSLFFSDSNSNSPFGVNDSQAWMGGVGIGGVFEF